MDEEIKKVKSMQRNAARLLDKKKKLEEKTLALLREQERVTRQAARLMEDSNSLLDRIEKAKRIGKISLTD